MGRAPTSSDGTPAAMSFWWSSGDRCSVVLEASTRGMTCPFVTALAGELLSLLLDSAPPFDRCRWIVPRQKHQRKKIKPTKTPPPAHAGLLQLVIRSTAPATSTTFLIPAAVGAAAARGCSNSPSTVHLNSNDKPNITAWANVAFLV